LSGGLGIGKPLNLSEASAIDAYIDLFRQAMKRRLVTDRRVVLPLSGGKDSRHILLELGRLGHPPNLAITIDLRNSNDAEVARQVASAYGIAQFIVPETELSLQAYLRLQRETSFNLSREIAFFAMADHLKEKDVIYDGIGGDVLSAGLFLTKELLEVFASGDWSETANRLFPPQIDEALAHLLQPEQCQRFSRGVAVERLSQELPRHRHAANPVGSFVFWNRTRRSIAAVPLCIMAKEERIVFTPYLDDELFDFLSALPASLLLDHQFHTKAIQRSFPDAGAVAFSEKKADDTVRRDGHIRFARQLFLAFGPRSRYVSMAYVWPRLLRSFVDPGYRRALEWFGPATVYLRSLESLDRGQSFSPVGWRKVSSDDTVKLSQ
jgi:asparagine synthetase B (glutamine-hydrolysing)